MRVTIIIIIRHAIIDFNDSHSHFILLCPSFSFFTFLHQSLQDRITNAVSPHLTC